MYGVCDIPPALNAGADCGNGIGACSWPGSAQETCTGPSTGGTVCKYETDVGAPATVFQDHAFPGNGSWDWNCDGVDEPEIKDTDKVYYGHSGLFGCGTVKFFENICNQQGMIPKYCDWPTYYGVCYPPPMGTGCGLPGYPDCTVPGCGYEYMWTVKCAVANDGTCHYASDTPYMQHCR